MKQEFDVYSIDEIDDENEKERIIKDEKEAIINGNFAFLENDLEEILSTDYDLQDVRLYYSLSYCQGDGLRFETASLLDSKIIKENLYKQLNKQEKMLLSKMIKENDLIFKTFHAGHHLYEYATVNDVDYDFDYYSNHSNFTQKQDNVIKKTLEILGNEYLTICKRLETIGYSYYDVSDDDVIDFIKERDAKYIKLGNKFVEI